MKKAVFSFILTLFICVCGITAVNANPTIYETSEEYAVTRGVTYKKVRQVTQAGLRDIYILTVDITDPYITLGEAESKKDYSLKEPLSELLTDNNAIAGVNGDFFGLAGTHSLSFGPVVKDSELVSVTTAINNGSFDNAAFFISEQNNPFIAFIKANLEFLNNGQKNINVLSINKVTDMIRPIVVTNAAMANTATIDARFKNLYKIVVTNNVISYISAKGETIVVPDNGYLIVMSEESANNNLFKFAVGQSAQLKLSAGLDINKMKMSIGGGGRILLDGKLSNDGSVASGRHPRTAVGISQDKTKIILMAVDGRTHSIGASHEEMAELLLKFGAYNAMHLDGGGSTTMAVQLPGQSKLSVVNRVSDSSQRKIINALGVFNNAPYGDITKLVVSAGSKNIVYRKTGVYFDIYGTDDYLRRLAVNRNEVVVSPNDPNGFFAGDLYYPQSLGEITVLTSYKNLVTETKLQCRELKELRPNKTSIKAMEGDEIELAFIGIDQLGEESYINSPMTFTVVPAGAGIVENRVFKPQISAEGYIECRLADVVCYISFQIGGRTVMAEPLDGGRALSFSSYPNTVTGVAGYAASPAYNGNMSAKLSYLIPKGEATQAAYLDFNNGIGITGEPMAIRMQVFGNNSGLWLRGKITDAEGASQNIDFASEINWEGWKTVNAIIPEGTKYPVTLDRVYVVTLQSVEDLKGEVCFDNIEAVYPMEEKGLLLPSSSKFKDPLQVELSDIISETSYDITALGKTLPEEAEPANYQKTLGKIKELAAKNAKRALYTGKTDLPTDIGVNVYKWNENYVFHYDENVCIIQMCASKGTLTQTNPWQWSRFINDIKTSGKDSVIIMMDKNPLFFSVPQEFDLFNNELSSLKALGKTIFVVSADGYETTQTLIGGVRYINLGSLWDAENKINENFRILRFRVSGNDIRFELKALD